MNHENGRKWLKIARTFDELKEEVIRENPSNLVICRHVKLLIEHNHRYSGFYCADYLLNALNFSNTLSEWETYVVDGLKMLKQVANLQDWNNMLQDSRAMSCVINCIYHQIDVINDYDEDANYVITATDTTSNNTTNTFNMVGTLLRYLFEEGLDPNISDAQTNTTTAPLASSVSENRRLFENVLSSREATLVAMQFLEFGADLSGKIIVKHNTKRSRDELSTWRISPAYQMREFDSFWDYLAGKVSTKHTVGSTGTVLTAETILRTSVNWINKERKDLVLALDSRRKRKMQWTDRLKSFGYQPTGNSKSQTSSDTETISDVSAGPQICAIHPLFSLVGVMDIVVEYADQCWKNDEVKMSAALKTVKLQK